MKLTLFLQNISKERSLQLLKIVDPFIKQGGNEVQYHIQADGETEEEIQFLRTLETAIAAAKAASIKISEKKDEPIQ